MWVQARGVYHQGIIVGEKLRSWNNNRDLDLLFSSDMAFYFIYDENYNIARQGLAAATSQYHSLLNSNLRPRFG